MFEGVLLICTFCPIVVCTRLQMDNDLYHGRGMLARILQAIGNTDSLVWINLVPELMPPSWRSGG